MNKSFFSTYFFDVIGHHYADFKGKTSRKEFWLFVLCHFLITLAVSLLGALINLLVGAAISLLLGLALFIPILALYVRRMHDIGKSGWWVLISMVPLVGAIWFFVLLCKKGESDGAKSKWNWLDTVIMVIFGFSVIALPVSSMLGHKASSSLFDSIEENLNDMDDTDSEYGEIDKSDEYDIGSDNEYLSPVAATQQSAHKSANAPSDTSVTFDAMFYCSNTGEDVEFEYGYEPFTYGDYVLLSGYNGALGGYSGNNVVSYERSSGTYNYVCFGHQVIIYSPMVISLKKNIVKEGECEAEDEWVYMYEYYSGTTNNELNTNVYSGTIGKYGITMELAFDPNVPKAIGTYYYNRNGENNRLIVFGDISPNGTLVLNAYDEQFYNTPSETMVLTGSEDGYTGYWERPNKDKMEVSLWEKYQKNPS